MDTQTVARTAKTASIPLAATPGAVKDAALHAIAAALRSHQDAILEANRQDVAAAEAASLAAPLLKRLRFDLKKLHTTIAGIESLIDIPDPVGSTQEATELAAGLELYRVSCPIGVIGVIFESRPDALVQISTLCLKSGNAVLLKGGREAVRTNRILAEVIVAATEREGIATGWLQLLETRAEVGAMLKLDDEIDLIIPRGSNEFVKFIMDNSSIPVLGHADGICHVYIDDAADLDMATAVVTDSKCQYVAVCNAAETLLVHAAVAATVLPRIATALATHDVVLLGCSRTAAIIDVLPAGESDWREEYLDYRLSIRVVDSLRDAIGHINRYGSGHTDAIVTANRDAAVEFMNLVDSGNVLWNCSTRFSDGYRYGLGAEIGISTNKIHARGPVGLQGLLIYKWKLLGTGQVVAPYANDEATFTHRRLNTPCPL